MGSSFCHILPIKTSTCLELSLILNITWWIFLVIQKHLWLHYSPCLHQTHLCILHRTVYLSLSQKLSKKLKKLLFFRIPRLNQQKKSQDPPLHRKRNWRSKYPRWIVAESPSFRASHFATLQPPDKCAQGCWWGVACVPPSNATIGQRRTLDCNWDHIDQWLELWSF